MEQDFSGMPPRTGKSRKWYVWMFIVLLAALILWSMAGDKITGLFNSLIAGLTPIIIAMVISFLCLRPMNFIENKLMKNAFAGSPRAAKYKRAISLTAVYILMIGIVVGIIVAAAPSIVALVQQFADATQLTNLMDKLKEVIVKIIQIFGVAPDDAINTATTITQSVQQFITEFVGSLNLENAVGAISFIFSLFMGFLVSFFLLKDKELIAKTGRRYTYAYYPRKQAEEVLTVTRRTKDMLNQYVVSTLIICFAIFIITLIGYLIMGVPYALMMALLFGILSIIPYVGGFIAAIPLLMVTLMAGDINLFLMSFIYGLAVWAIVTTFLPPLVMSKRMNTRAMIMVLALILGGAMFGVVGMILSGPIASVITIVMNERLQVREARREHEEMIEAGIIDKNFYDISEMLDLTQDNADVVAIEKEEDDFNKLQATKNKKKKSTEDNDESLNVVLSSKSSKKEKINKKKLTQHTEEVEQKETPQKQDNEDEAVDEFVEKTE